jgi:phage terminase Nu1 subunit (DNA packaging protein)
VLSATKMSQLFDCTVRQLELLAKKGVVVRVAPGEYDADASTTAYIRHLREQAASRAGQDATVDSVTANIQWKQASTELLQVRLAKEAGELLPVEDVREVWGRVVRGIRQFVMSLPGKIAFEVPTLTVHDRGVIERICRDGLEDASLGRGFAISTSPDMYPIAKLTASTLACCARCGNACNGAAGSGYGLAAGDGLPRLCGLPCF